MMTRLRNCLSRFRSDKRGISALEIAIAVPVALALTLNGIEMTRYVLLHQKTERATMTVADLVSQGEVLTAGDLDNIFQAGALITEPFDFGANAAMIVSSVVGQAAGPIVEWQRVYGADPQASGLGGQGGPASLPAGFVVAESESVIMAEIQYRYTPMFPDNPILGGAIANNTVYNYAIFRPRYTVKVRLGS
ncbi:pilus assembly protein [Thalassospiraceae bacterium LMO-JJ14]|nr:pilus assembly protein [Thalassospiraceae bacterium LMO-JJ14]